MHIRQNNPLCSSFYLIAQLLLGVNAAGCSEGVVEENEGVAFHVEGQVRAEGGEGKTEYMISL